MKRINSIEACFVLKPKKIKGLFALLAWKSGGSVDQFFFCFVFVLIFVCFVLFCLFCFCFCFCFCFVCFCFCLTMDTEEMQCHSCVFILGHTQSPRIGLILVLEGVVFHYSRLKCLFGTVLYYTFWHFVLTILFENAKLRMSKKKKKKRWPLFSKIFGWSEKGKQTSFSLGLMSLYHDVYNHIKHVTVCDTIYWYLSVTK